MNNIKLNEMDFQIIKASVSEFVQGKSQTAHDTALRIDARLAKIFRCQKGPGLIAFYHCEWFYWDVQDVWGQFKDWYGEIFSYEVDFSGIDTEVDTADLRKEMLELWDYYYDEGVDMGDLSFREMCTEFAETKSEFEAGLDDYFDHSVRGRTYRELLMDMLLSTGWDRSDFPKPHHYVSKTDRLTLVLPDNRKIQVLAVPKSEISVLFYCSKQKYLWALGADGKEYYLPGVDKKGYGEFARLYKANRKPTSSLLTSFQPVRT